MLIYQRGKRAQGYSESGLDNIVTRAAKRAGIERRVGHHTLRRAGARLAYFADVPLVEIMEGLGHTSERVTIRYLGLTVIELAQAQRKVYDCIQVIKVQMELRQGGAAVIGKKSEKQEMRVPR